MASSLLCWQVVCQRGPLAPPQDPVGESSPFRAITSIYGPAAEHTVPLSSSAVRLILEALEASKEHQEGANDQAVFASRFKGVSTLARHSLSQAVRRIVKDKAFTKFTPHDLRRTGATLAQAARLPVDFVKALLNHNDKGVTGVYARWHMFEEKREAVMAIESAVLPLMPIPKALAARAPATCWRNRDLYFAGNRHHQGFGAQAFRAFESAQIETRSFRLDEPQCHHLPAFWATRTLDNVHEHYVSPQ
jgi:Phage integrase family